MIFSSDRQRAISGWLLENNPSAFDDALKLQKYLFFYEVSTYIDDPSAAELDHLRGYKKGPVFSNVYGDYKHDYYDFEKSSKDMYTKKASLVNVDFAKHASFLVSIMNDAELSEFTHRFHVWSAKKERINSDESQVPLDESDINDDDKDLIKEMREVYPTKFIQQSVVLSKGLLKYVLSVHDNEQLSPEQEGLLEQIAETHADEFDNPVFVTISTSGALELD